MSLSFLRESFFNIHLQVTNKGLVSPLGLSPAIWELEVRSTSHHIQKLVINWSWHCWVRTLNTDLTCDTDRSPRKPGNVSNKRNEDSPQTWGACQSRAPCLLCLIISSCSDSPLPHPRPLPPCFFCLFVCSLGQSRHMLGIFQIHIFYSNNTLD